MCYNRACRTTFFLAEHVFQHNMHCIRKLHIAQALRRTVCFWRFLYAKNDVRWNTRCANRVNIYAITPISMFSVCPASRMQTHTNIGHTFCFFFIPLRGSVSVLGAKCRVPVFAFLGAGARNAFLSALHVHTIPCMLMGCYTVRPAFRTHTSWSAPCGHAPNKSINGTHILKMMIVSNKIFAWLYCSFVQHCMHWRTYRPPCNALNIHTRCTAFANI